MKKLIIIFLIILLQTSYSQWEKCNPKGNYPFYKSIAISGDKIFLGANSDGIYLSNDTCKTWYLISDSSDELTRFLNCYSIYVSYPDIFVGSSRGIFHTSDDGKNWTTKNNGLTYSNNSKTFSVRSFAVLDNNLFVGTDNGVYFSTNNGDNWINNGNYEQGEVFALAISGNNIYVGTWGGGVFVSTDNGNTWTQKNNGLITYMDNYITAIAIKNNNIFIGAGSGIFLSTNNGENWIPKNNGLSGIIDFQALAISDNKIFAGTEGSGIFISTDNGDNWYPANDGLPSDGHHKEDYIINCIVTSGDIILAGTEGHLWKAKVSDFVINNVPEKSNIQTFSLFPNPVSDYIELNFQNNNSTVIKIYNELGIPIIEKKVQNENNLKIDTRDYAPGVYFCQITAGSYVETRKFIIIH